ncbi:uncharacterized protein LOC124361215 [Homalodisca vitripennis]|uniref:uncharacterized protein LOC124361215 n=1 Tax=Homalodisca vitripennis TaxID=197043 RepID=UPI001EEB7C9B|nr:uncharacterized protein LOC124361215 [Homalodisca vitripennis]
MRVGDLICAFLVLLEIGHFTTEITAVAQSTEDEVKEGDAEQKSSIQPDTSGAEANAKVEGTSINVSAPPAAEGDGLQSQQSSNNKEVKSGAETTEVTDDKNEKKLGAGAEISLKDSSGGAAEESSKPTDNGNMPNAQELLGTKVSVGNEKPESRFSPFIILLPRTMLSRQQRQTTGQNARLLFVPNVIKNMFQGIFGQRNPS